MDIERELERVIEENKDRKYNTFETSVDLVAQDCLQEIRRLKQIIEFYQETSQWISVEDRLPMEEPDGRHSASKMVLVYAYNGYSDRFASTDITVDGKWYNYPEPEFAVTHWMPLPKPPESED